MSLGGKVGRKREDLLERAIQVTEAALWRRLETYFTAIVFRLEKYVDT